jgi:hypothetical protein
MTTWTAPDIASIRGDNSRPLQKIFGSLTEYLKSTSGQNTEVSQTYVRNGETTTLTVGTVVYLAGQQGDRATVKRAYNTSDATSAKTLGIVAENIPANSDGLITTLGYVYKCNTSAFTAGQTLYLGSTAGTMTATKPYAPNHLVYVGVVVRANAGNGIIYVRCQNGYELDEIHDAQILSPTAGDILMRNSSNLWINTPQTSITSVGTLTAGTVPTSLLSGTFPAASLSGTALPATIVSSSLTSVGTISTGTWNGSLIAGQYGGTGVANTGKTITIGGNFTTSGAFTTTLTVTANTSVTLPTSGTLATTDASSLTSGTLASARVTGSYTGITGVGTLTAGSIPATLLTGTVASGSLPSVNIGTTSVDLTRASGALTLAGITLTSPTFTSPVLGTPTSGTLTNCTFPTLNQNTTGSAASLTTARTIWGQSFNGTANVSGAITGVTTYVGTGQLEVQNNNIFISGTSGSYFQHPTNTGSGSACQWATIFGNYYLVRNTSTKADKENIQPLNGVLKPEMIDAVDVSLWNRTIAPNIPEVGPMAEDMNDISPFLATHGMDVDEDGNICQTPPNGISPNGWMSLLTIALQDTRKRLQQLERV